MILNLTLFITLILNYSLISNASEKGYLKLELVQVVGDIIYIFIHNFL